MYSEEALPSIWDGVTVSESLEQNADGAYLIQSAADLAYFRNSLSSNQYSGQTILLMVDVVWDSGNASEWFAGTSQPTYQWNIGDIYGSPFLGTFDGLGHTISGLYSSHRAAAFIPYSGSGSVIKNLAIVNSYFTGDRRIGSFVGQARTGLTTVENVYSDAYVVSTGTTADDGMVGGIVGSLNGGSSYSLVINNAVFAGRVFGHLKVGGIFGGVGGNTNTVSLTNCFHMGSINASGTEYIGGIYGGGRNPISLIIKNCINLSYISGSSAGGICGASSGTTTTNIAHNIYNNSNNIAGDKTSEISGNTAMSAPNIQKLTAETLPSGFNVEEWSVATIWGD